MDEATFDLRQEDDYAISVALDSAHLLLRHEGISRQDSAAIRRAVQVLGRMPVITPGADVSFGVCYRYNRESRSVDFTVTDERFEISVGGVSNSGFGSDAYSEPGWCFDIDGDGERGAELCTIANTVQELLNLGGEITASDESELVSESDDVPATRKPAADSAFQQERRAKILSVLRWIVLVPAVLLGSFVAYVVGVSSTRWGLYAYCGLPMESVFARLVLMGTEGITRGASVVYIAAYVAPRYKRQVAVVFAGLVLLLGGAAMALALLDRDFWDISSNALYVCSACVVAFGIFTRQMLVKETATE